MKQLTIGAVSQLTQIPAHTLRKWESRHGIATPTRTETGRRVYTQAQVEELRLVKRLTASGHGLAHLAVLQLDELRALAGLHEDVPEASVSALYLVGPNVGRMLVHFAGEVNRELGDGLEWLNKGVTPEGGIAVAIECTTLAEPTLTALETLATRVARVLVVYAFAPRKAIARLQSAGIICTAAPHDEAAINALLESTPASDEKGAEGEGSGGSHRRFANEELARIAALSPSIACECPNHIAKLLMDISAFEQYSLECVDTEPKDRELHNRLGAISAKARRLFEEALIQVAQADGLKIETRRELAN